MRESVTIMIEARAEINSKASKRLRENGYIPGNVYGNGLEPFAIKIKEEELKKKLARYGKNYLFDLDLNGEQTRGVMIKEIQHLPIQNSILSVSLQQVSLVDETKIDLTIKITGIEILDSKKLLVVRQMDTIPVKGLPQDIPNNIEIDVSELKEGDKISISDINFPQGITADIDGSQTVLSVGASVLSAQIADEENVTDETVKETQEA